MLGIAILILAMLVGNAVLGAFIGATMHEMLQVISDIRDRLPREGK